MTHRRAITLTAALALVPLLAALAAPSATEPGGSPLRDVRRVLASDVVVNWTRERLEVTASAYDPNLATDSKPLEQRAISVIDARIPSAVAEVPVQGSATLGELGVEPPTPTLQGWSIVEGRYFTTGRVEVVGALDLREVLAGWSLEHSVTRPADRDTSITGALIDVRGLGVLPAWAPTLRGEDGVVLFDGTLWKDAAWDHAPVVWVGDPAHPSAGAAGLSPAMFVAVAYVDGSIVLSSADAARFVAGVGASVAVGEGSIVLVVEP